MAQFPVRTLGTTNPFAAFGDGIAERRGTIGERRLADVLRFSHVTRRRPRRSLVTTVAVMGIAAAGACGVGDKGASENAQPGSDSGSDSGSEVGADAPLEACSSSVASGKPCTGFGASCTAMVSCTSGQVPFTLTCGSGVWAVTYGGTCDKPYDECYAPERVRCEAGYWRCMGGYPEQPLPCPATAPTGMCFGPVPEDPGLGYDPKFCGYPCATDAGSGWMVVECNGDWISGECT